LGRVFQAPLAPFIGTAVAFFAGTAVTGLPGNPFRKLDDCGAPLVRGDYLLSHVNG